MAITLDETIGAFSQAVHLEDVNRLKFMLTGRSNNNKNAIAVYQNNTRNAILNAMQIEFPVCVQVIGVQCFHQLVLRYLNAEQLQTCGLEHIGKGFPQFLRGETSVCKITPYLPDLCELEYKVCKSLQAADRQQLDAQAFAIAYQKPQQMVLQLAPDIQLLKLDYPVDKIWQWHQQGGNGGYTEAEPGCYLLVVARHQFNPQLNLVSEPLHQLLQLLTAKLPMNRLRAHASYSQELIEQCLMNGWIDRFYVTA